MDNNEISMDLDVKLDVHKIRIKTWKRMHCKIEAVKCLPCFLRISFTHCYSIENKDEDELEREHDKSFSVSINIPGNVTINETSSRTKKFSYGIFWTQNRRDCFIYFSMESELNCRRHMKWLKKSIKNLELYRQIVLEQRRNSRGPGPLVSLKGVAKNVNKNFPAQEFMFPNIIDGNRSSTWSSRVSRASEIYEEIFECTSNTELQIPRRSSRISIASGIYEEMKPTLESTFNAIIEEALQQPPPVPPLPPPRKRINTFEMELKGGLGEIPRCNTNPETELVKKKKYRNVFDNFFGNVRSKRAESVSESQTCSVEDLLKSTTPKPNKNDAQHSRSIATDNSFSNDITAAKRPKPSVISRIVDAKRNSFSSPDLSKINFIDNFENQHDGNILQNSFSLLGDLDLSGEINIETSPLNEAPASEIQTQGISLESFNVSEQIPNNFNFSACNTSKINLIGANGAVPSLAATKKTQILIDELTGYCVMAPIKEKLSLISNTYENIDIKPTPKTHTESTSSDYSTGSYSSTASSCTNSAEDHLNQQPALVQNLTEMSKKLESRIPEESTIYENMHGSLNSPNYSNVNITSSICPPTTTNFTNHFYENLLTMKASRELEHRLPNTLSTSTPTESPHNAANLSNATPEQQNEKQKLQQNQDQDQDQEEENYYQTPRKSIISIDDKIPSYYPNDICDVGKAQRKSPSSVKSKRGTPSPNSKEKTSRTFGIRDLANVNSERKENLLYMPSQDCKLMTTKNEKHHNKYGKIAHKTKNLSAAHKISENVYVVNHNAKRNQPIDYFEQKNNVVNDDDLREKLQTELIQLAILQKIDFKFDDTKTFEERREQLESKQQELEMKLQQKENEIGVFEDVSSNYDSFASPHSTSSTSRNMKFHDNSNSNSNCNKSELSTTQNSQTSSNNCNNNDGTPPSSVLSQSKIENHASPDLHISTVRKFASLPRFRKIDFSPLRVKINNVLQRAAHQQQ